MDNRFNRNSTENSTKPSEWQSIEEAKRDPSRLIRVRADALEAWIDFQVAQQVEEKLAAVVHALTKLPPDAQVLGPSASANWLNGNQVKKYRKLTLVWGTCRGKPCLRSMTQRELGKSIGMAQPMIGQLERLGYAPVTGLHEDLVDRLIEVVGPAGLTRELLQTRYDRRSSAETRRVDKSLEKIA